MAQQKLTTRQRKETLLEEAKRTGKKGSTSITLPVEDIDWMDNFGKEQKPKLSRSFIIEAALALYREQIKSGESE